MRTQETCTILIETDFQSVRTFFFLPISFTSKHYPFHHLLKYVSKICDVSGVLPTWTHHTGAFLALQTLCPTLTPAPHPGAEPVKTLAGSKDRTGLGRGETERRPGEDRQAPAPTPCPLSPPPAAIYFPAPGPRALPSPESACGRPWLHPCTRACSQTCWD